MSNPSSGSAKSRAKTKTEQMRAERAAQAARQKRNQRILAVVSGVVILGLLAAIVFAVVNAAGGDGKDDGGNLAKKEAVVPEAVVDGAIPVGDADAPVTVDLYFDYMCPACGAFEEGNGDDLTRLIDEGTARVDLRVMNFLDQLSEGTEYSTRAGNALATVAVEAPDSVWEFHDALYANQPAEGTEGLSDDELAEIATEVGVPADVADTFADGTYAGWVTQSNAEAGEDGISRTPTVMIDGETFEEWSEPGALAAAIEAAAEAE